MSGPRATPARAGRWWPYLAVAGLFWALPAVALLVGYLTLPDYNASGQCEGFGGPCVLSPKDGTVFAAMFYYPFVFAGGLLTMGVMAMTKKWRPGSR